MCVTDFCAFTVNHCIAFTAYPQIGDHKFDPLGLDMSRIQKRPFSKIIHPAGKAKKGEALHVFFFGRFLTSISQSYCKIWIDMVKWCAKSPWVLFSVARSDRLGNSIRSSSIRSSPWRCLGIWRLQSLQIFQWYISSKNIPRVTQYIDTRLIWVYRYS